MLNVVRDPLVILNTVEVRSLNQWTIFAVGVFHLLKASLLLYPIYSCLQVERQSFLSLTTNVYTLYLVFRIAFLLQPEWPLFDFLCAQLVPPNLQRLVEASNDIS